MFRGKLPKSDSELEQWCSRASLGAHDLFLRNAVAKGVAYTHDPLPPQLQNALLQVWSACDVCVCVCVCVCVHRGGGVGSELGNFCTMRHIFFVLVNVILRVWITLDTYRRDLSPLNSPQRICLQRDTSSHPRLASTPHV